MCQGIAREGLNRNALGGGVEAFSPVIIDLNCKSMADVSGRSFGQTASMDYALSRIHP
jgi:hypothetical protein